MPPKTLKHNPVSQEIEALSQKYDHDPKALLEILQEMQGSEGYLTAERIAEISRALRVPQHKVQGIATFYTMLSTAPHANNTLPSAMVLPVGFDELWKFGKMWNTHLETTGAGERWQREANHRSCTRRPGIR